MGIENYNSIKHLYERVAYHESGHAIIAMLLGYDLIMIKVVSETSGYVLHSDYYINLNKLIQKSISEERMSSQLFRLWLDMFWIADSGSIVEEEFNLVPDDELLSTSECDRFSKFSWVTDDEEEFTYVENYFYKHVVPYSDNIESDCRKFIRKEVVSELIQVLSEALLKQHDLEGYEVLDVLLQNKANRTRNYDLFHSDLVLGVPNYSAEKDSLGKKQLALF